MMFTFTILVQDSTRRRNCSNEATEGNKEHPNRKGESQNIPVYRSHDLI
jgi:hypothetical protein